MAVTMVLLVKLDGMASETLRVPIRIRLLPGEKCAVPRSKARNRDREQGLGHGVEPWPEPGLP